MNMYFLSALVLGFTGSVHCVGMCGPLVMTLPFHAFAGRQKALAILLYHASRSLAYAVLGSFVGWMGWGFKWFGWLQTLSFLLGAALLFSLLWPMVRRSFLPFAFPVEQVGQLWTGFVQKQLHWALRKKGFLGMAWMGFLNGFLPCGMVYMAMAGAMASANTSQAAGFMLFFGWGTLPAMVVLAYLGQQMPLRWRTGFRKAIPWTTALVGVLLILRGLNLDIPFISPYINPHYPAAAVECHK